MSKEPLTTLLDGNARAILCSAARSQALPGHLRRQGQQAKIGLWAYNSHRGDARDPEMGERGEVNVGQLVRERHGQDRKGTLCRRRTFSTPALGR